VSLSRLALHQDRISPLGPVGRACLNAKAQKLRGFRKKGPETTGAFFSAPAGAFNKMANQCVLPPACLEYGWAPTRRTLPPDCFVGSVAFVALSEKREYE
jgi:hypothetical protein